MLCSDNALGPPGDLRAAVGRRYGHELQAEGEDPAAAAVLAALGDLAAPALLRGAPARVVPLVSLSTRLEQRSLLTAHCSLLTVHLLVLVLVAKERKLRCVTYKGAFEGEWVFEAPVRFLMVTGGPPGRESVLVGLRSGQVVKVILGNWFPVSVLRHGGDAPTAAAGASTQRAERGVRCLDLNRSRSLLALVDERAVLAVYDVTGASTARECIFQVRPRQPVLLCSSYLLVLVSVHAHWTGVKRDELHVEHAVRQHARCVLVQSK